MGYTRYKKYYKDNKIIEIAKKKEAKTDKKINLTKPLPLKNKELTENHKKLIKNALIIQQRQFKRISHSNPRTEKIIKKHNEIMKIKPFDKVIDIFQLIAFFD